MISKAPVAFVGGDSVTDTVNMREADAQSKGQLTCLELFAGPGGLALGAHNAGFRHVALIEFEKAAAATLKLNCTGPLGMDPKLVRHVDAREVGYKPFAGKVDLLTAGPPCQPFSAGGHGRGTDDARNMFPILLDAIGIIMPRAVLIENVRGLTRDKFKDYFGYIQARLRFPLHKHEQEEDWCAHYRQLHNISAQEFAESEQYVVWPQLVDAADFGIPQHRHRVFIVALRRDLGHEPFELPVTHSREALVYDQWVTGTYWRQHGIAQPVQADPRDQRLVSELKGRLLAQPQSLAWRTVRDELHNLPLPVNRGQQATMANHVQHPGARAYKGHSGSTLDRPAKALKSGDHGTPGGENMVQLEDGGVRYVTIREAARLQTFPDTWSFSGAWGACIKQLGNAVPVDLARLFAQGIHDRLVALPNPKEPKLGVDIADSAANAVVSTLAPRTRQTGDQVSPNVHVAEGNGR